MNPTTLANTSAHHSTLDLVLGTGLVVQIVLIVLVLASVFSWAIIFAKWKSLSRAKKESVGFLDLFWNTKSLENIFNETRHFSSSPVSNVFRAGYMEFQKLTARATEKQVSNNEMALNGIDNVHRALRKTAMLEMLRLEKLLSYLATIASVAPFIGLFGTVWGIMNSFQGLSQGGPATIQRVAPGISEALIATAVGLAAAIPAVIAYNQFVGKLRGLRADVDSFSADFVNILKRNYLGS